MNDFSEESYRLLAAGYLRKQARQLASQLDGIREGVDIEFIHRARVATRRLRAGLEVFADCYDDADIERWRKAIRRVTKGLGEARDLDVQADFVLGVLDGLQNREHYPGIARLMVRLDRRREKVQPKVLRAIEKLQAGGVVRELSSHSKKTIASLEKRKVTVQSLFVFDKAEEHILTRLDELLAFQDCLARADQKDRHHEMRIAAKRLRYTMEICKPAYNDGLNEFIGSVKEMQSFLGDIHDCDVWIDSLEAFLQEEKERIVDRFGHDGPVARLKAGIDHMESDRRRCRDELFEKLCDYWAELERQELWDRLRETVRRRAERSDQAAASGGNGRPAGNHGGKNATSGPHFPGSVTGSDEPALSSAEPAHASHQTEI